MKKILQLSLTMTRMMLKVWGPLASHRVLLVRCQALAHCLGSHQRSHTLLLVLQVLVVLVLLVLPRLLCVALPWAGRCGRVFYFDMAGCFGLKI